MYDRYIAEAQDLIRRFDIYADVRCRFQRSCQVGYKFGTRPAVTLHGDGGVDPFRARFLLGLNDGEVGIS